MNCPACGATMTSLALDGHQGTQIDLDLCATCQVIWFDQFESLRLAPGGILLLFRMIGGGHQRSSALLPGSMKCPRCEMRLLVTHDRQRNTPFQYWRCGRDHGRLTTFIDFLREKDFIRPLTAQQISELRQNVQMINCSNCGAPVDLVKDSVCPHCGTPISMLDVKQIERMTSELAREAGRHATIDPTLPLQLELEKHHVEALFKAYHMDQSEDVPTFDLVDAGVRWISRWLK